MNRMKTIALVAGLALIALTGCKQDPAVQHRSQGDALFRKGKFSEAAAEYGLSLQADPKQEKLWEKKAYAHMQAKELDQADEAYLKKLDGVTDPDAKAEIYRNLANAYLKPGPLQRSEKYFLEALKLNPKDETALSWLGEIYSQLGGARKAADPAVPMHLEKAIGYYDQWLAVNPKALFAYVNKRIALAKWINSENDEVTAATKEAEQFKKSDKTRAKDALDRAAKLQAHIAPMRATYDSLNQTVKDLQAELKAAADGGTAAPPAGGSTATPATP